MPNDTELDRIRDEIEMYSFEIIQQDQLKKQLYDLREALLNYIAGAAYATNPVAFVTGPAMVEFAMVRFLVRSSLLDACPPHYKPVISTFDELWLRWILARKEWSESERAEIHGLFKNVRLVS